jgi:SAM-dependent methyltransferase
MNAADYDAWYDTPRGRWVGDAECRMLLRAVEPRQGESLLDVGCGTGWFTRRMARLPGVQVTGLDINAEWLAYARERDAASDYIEGDALALPFADNSVDGVVSIAALCFTADWRRAVGEIVRVSRGRFAIGMLNRRSLLWREKGRDGGSGAYRGACWVTPEELRDSVAGLPVADVRLRSAVFLPSGSLLARAVECLLPAHLAIGGLVVLSGRKR